MKKYFVSMVIAFSALVLLNGCIVSEKKLTDRVQSAIVDEERANGKTLEVTEFSLDDKTGKNYQGVLKGKLDGKDVVYDVKVVEVKTMNYDGKKRQRYTRRGIQRGATVAFKKAIVTLAEGQTIDFYSNL
jgi:hypothetical protein